MVQEEHIKNAIINHHSEDIINYIDRIIYGRERNIKLYCLGSMLCEWSPTNIFFVDIIGMINMHFPDTRSAIFEPFFVIMIIEEKYYEASVIYEYLKDSCNKSKNMFDFIKYKNWHWTDMEFRYKLDKFISKYYRKYHNKDKYNFAFCDKIKIFI